MIDWRPLYNLYNRISDVHDRSAILAPANIERGIFNTFIKHARLYFSVNATQEMLDEWRALLCPYDTSFSRGMEKLELFLPTVVYPDENDLSFKYEMKKKYKKKKINFFPISTRLWANELLDLWISINTPHMWETVNIFTFKKQSLNTIN